MEPCEGVGCRDVVLPQRRGCGCSESINVFAHASDDYREAELKPQVRERFPRTAIDGQGENGDERKRDDVTWSFKNAPGFCKPCKRGLGGHLAIGMLGPTPGSTGSVIFAWILPTVTPCCDTPNILFRVFIAAPDFS